jgi:hypothetical protein
MQCRAHTARCDGRLAGPGIDKRRQRSGNPGIENGCPLGMCGPAPATQRYCRNRQTGGQQQEPKGCAVETAPWVWTTTSAYPRPISLDARSTAWFLAARSSMKRPVIRRAGRGALGINSHPTKTSIRAPGAPQRSLRPTGMGTADRSPRSSARWPPEGGFVGGHGCRAAPPDRGGDGPRLPPGKRGAPKLAADLLPRPQPQELRPPRRGASLTA